MKKPRYSLRDFSEISEFALITLQKRMSREENPPESIILGGRKKKRTYLLDDLIEWEKNYAK